MMSLQISERDTSLDLIRVCAVFLVVINHTFEYIYGFSVSEVSNMSLYAKIYAFLGFSIGRIGVPLFVMLSGYLLLTREYDLSSTKHFYKKNLLPLLITWEIWVIIYNIFIAFRNNSAFNIKTLIKNAIFVKRVDVPHAWYVPMILGMYLFIPFIAQILQKLDRQLLLLIMIIVFFYCFIVPSVNLVRQAANAPTEFQFLSQLDLNYSGKIYGVYLVLGYCIHYLKEKIQYFFKRKVIPPVAICSIVLLLFVNILSQISLFSIGYRYMVWYDFFTEPFLGMIVFCLLLQLKVNNGSKILLTSMAASVFGVYLIHEVILLPIIDLLRPFIGRSLLTIIMSIGVSILSFCLVELLNLIPHCGKILFLRKH